MGFINLAIKEIGLKIYIMSSFKNTGTQTLNNLILERDIIIMTQVEALMATDDFVSVRTSKEFKRSEWSLKWVKFLIVLSKIVFWVKEEDLD